MEFVKYTFTCDPDSCDALLEFTARDGFGFPNGEVAMQCPCGRKMNYITTEQKEAPMEQTTTYSKDALIMVSEWDTQAGETVYSSLSAKDVEMLVRDSKRYRDRTNELQSQINKIIDNMTEDYWYNPNTDKETILSDLCEILNHTPTKTVEFTATMKFTGSIELELGDWEDFDLETVLADAYVDINNGQVIIDDYELYDANEC